MRTIYLISLLFLASLTNAQNIIQDNINPVQGGTAVIQNGKAVIKLNEEATKLLSDKSNLPEYIISVTPLCNCGQFYVSEKGTDSFTVQQAGNADGDISFDYVVYVKRNINLNSNIYLSKAPGAAK